MLEHDRHSAVDALYLHFQEAFNKVPDGKYMPKVEALSSRNKIVIVYGTS